jgi:hypothetical protein
MKTLTLQRIESSEMKVFDPSVVILVCPYKHQLGFGLAVIWQWEYSKCSMLDQNVHNRRF